jgi:MinD-like ATPase involved in chromosome partitioning or flagellar assembly/tetratricopeptide (TPR) repeat protein
MTPSVQTGSAITRAPGLVYTFYSYKGGVGRSMAVANVGALLSKSQRVLLVDFDLEAPGVEQFFLRPPSKLYGSRREKPGIVDLIESYCAGQKLNWRDCLIEVSPFGGEDRLSILSAGRESDDYVQRVQGLDWPRLFDECNLGWYLEELRQEWLLDFDFVLLDSRTGITDVGGICTILLPDALVLLFTTANQSLDGTIDVMNRAQRARAGLAVDRSRLLGVPVPARDDSRTEVELGEEWRAIFAERLGFIYKDWLPKGVEPRDVLQQLRIPYIAYWSFYERLPVVEKGTEDPQSIGFAYDLLARLLRSRLDWHGALRLAQERLGDNRAFISYSHDPPENEAKVLALANRLRGDGIDAVLDQYESFPTQGWALWTKEQARSARFVLIVCTERYLQQAEDQGTYPGAQLAAQTIREIVSDATGTNTRAVPVLLEEGDLRYVPTELQRYNQFQVYTKDGYDALCRLLTGQPELPKPALGHSNPVVFISSTARDLPEHRKEVLDACMRQGFVPVMIEHLPTSDDDAIRESLRMVDDADVYLGILAYRYGYVPKGHAISITEMEYNRAGERGIPRLMFVMHKDHPIRIEDVEMGKGAEKLKAFKERAEAEKVLRFFKSVDDLRSDVIDTLSKMRAPNPSPFHYMSDIPAPPEAYIAHPFTLLQTGRLVGRQPELNSLTEWVAKSDKPVLDVVAIGGIGKSALTWHWFNEVAPLEMKPLAGRLWWSFYESDATFENFVVRALAYVTNQSREEVQKITPPEREEQLLAVLNRDPYLVVLDGLERTLIAYARTDATRLSDEEAGHADSRLRKAADPHDGAFLRKLSACRAARVLISSRLHPADLEDRLTGDPLPGCQRLDLRGLSDDDALNLWRTFGVSGTREDLLPVFHSFDKHPLLIQALAGEIKRDRRAGGDFERWRRAHPQFDPLGLPGVKEASAQVLQFAFQGLSEPAAAALRTLAAFRMPASYDTLFAVLVGDGKPFADERVLDRALADLEDRGLLGWDRRANRYVLHPIVRGVVWNGLDQGGWRDVYAVLLAYFEPLSAVEWLKVDRLDDLTPAIELYNTLIGLGRYEDAYVVFRDRLDLATLYRLSASRLRVELLGALFPDGLDRPPRLAGQRDQAFTRDALALGYQFSGRPGAAVPLFQRDNALSGNAGDEKNFARGLCNLADALRFAGRLRESESAARQALGICRKHGDHFVEGITLYLTGLALAARGATAPSARALETALRVFVEDHQPQMEGVTGFYLSQRALWLGDAAAARQWANRAWELAHDQRHEVDFIRAARLQGEAALALGDLLLADERLHHALTRARTVERVEEELPALTALAELRRREGKPAAARELLQQVWEPAERGPYPLFHADALNVLAQIERDAGNTTAAIRAATEAYEKAWCDGPPFAYHWGLEKAKAHLAALGAPEPALPPFDESKYEPMPEIEIDPPEPSPQPTA